MHVLEGILLATVMVAGGQVPEVEDKYLETIKVTDNIYVFKPRIDWNHGNGVAIIGKDGVFFIDTYIQFNYAEEAIRRLRQVTKLPVRYVLNTHWHNDHVMGNGVFKRRFPQCRFIAHDSTAAYMEQQIKSAVAGEADNIKSTITQLTRELKDGKRSGGAPITAAMKPFWESMLRESQEYQRQYRPEPFVTPDITFSDSLTFPWGDQTLRLIHMPQNAHSEGDVIVWIPEQRVLVSGDLVVGPTPYATQSNSSGMVPALQALIAMNPAVIIPGHGAVQYDLAYVQILVRAFTEDRRAADAAIAAKTPVKQAADSIAFPEIDRLFTGDGGLKQWAYRTFFARSLIINSYKAAGALPSPAK
jgi:cyclase